MKRTINLLTLALALSAFACPASAQLEGQAKPSAPVLAKLTGAARILSGTSNKTGQARADLLLALEKEPAADVVNALSYALADDDTYRAILATFEDALDTTTDERQKQYLLANITRTYLTRARLTPVSVGQNPYVTAAARTAARFPADTRDPAIWELKGDIATEQGNTEAATAAYQKMGTYGGNPAFSQYKTARAWQKARRWSEAQAAYNRALQRENVSGDGGKLLYHLIYQGLAEMSLQRGDFPSAVNALSRSAKVKQDDANPYRLRLDVARMLLARGYKAEVAAYAETALKLDPEDTDAAALLAQARGTGS